MLTLSIKYPSLWIYIHELKRFLATARRARDIQREVLLNKLRRNASSDFGRNHGFSKICSIADYRRQIPITTYEYYHDYVERLKKGDIGAMFGPGTKVLMLAITSGTTGRCKYIPITKEFFDEYRRGWYLWTIGVYRDHTDLLQAKMLKLASNWRQFCTEGGIPCGNISGLVAETAPWVARGEFALPRAVYRIGDPFSKHYTALRLSLVRRDIGLIGTANPSTLIEFAKLANAHRESLIRDIFDGTLSPEVELPVQIRTDLRRSINRRDPWRAQELERIIKQTGTLFPRDFWPKFSVLAVWMGGSVGVYMPQLKKYYGTPAVRDHGLSASEGRMTIPLQDGTSEGILEFVNHYFEFIPEAEHETEKPTVLEAHELEVGKDYYILLTTSAGLYRYDIHDLVRCVGFEGEAPILTFLNKGAHFSNITGEKLNEFQVISAVQRAFAELGWPIEDFTLAPVIGERPGYVLLLEKDWNKEEGCRLVDQIERHLQELNCEYLEKRRTGRLRELSIKQIPRGTWRALRLQRTEERGNFEEYKHPFLVNDFNFIERLLESAVALPRC